MVGTLNKGSLVKSSGGGNGGGSSFPTIVTDSGSSLPVDLTGYNEGDTFLNTSDKKIYKTTTDAYELNTNSNLAGGTTYSQATIQPPNIDYTTGILTDTIFSPMEHLTDQYFWRYAYRHNILNLRWQGTKNYKFHIKLDSSPTDDKIYHFVYMDNPISTSAYTVYRKIYIGIKNKKLYIGACQIGGYDTSNVVEHTLLCDYELDTNIEYYISVNKQNSDIVTTITLNSYDGQVLKTQTITSPIEDVNSWSNYTYIYYGGSWLNTTYKTSNFNTYGYGFSIGKIYLLDCSGELLKASSELFWDSGVAIEDKNEYADKTNGALYLYSDDELVKIGGNLTKKVYTISADNTSTLDVSADFTRIVDVLKNGVELALTDDYTISSGVITFVTALSTTDKITVKGD